VVATAGSPLTAVHLVLDGEIATVGSERRTWAPCQVFGALEVLADRDASATTMTTVATTTLQLLAPDVLEILEDSFGVMLAALRGLAAAQSTRRPPRARTAAVHSLGLVERLILLRQQLAFSRAPLESLVALAHAAEDATLPAGRVVTRAGAAGTSSYLIVEGTARATDESRAARVLGAGDAIGHLSGASPAGASQQITARELTRCRYGGPVSWPGAWSRTRCSGRAG
jgi:CRP-like cAMP-binding protein